MIDDVTLEKVKHFPPQYQQQVKNFIEFLEERKINLPQTEKKRRGFGAGKGFVIFMADDFDAPLEDFKDYM
jgi:mRNA-degrading endonuclease RelE of RelBE toxin-antitoxin system